MAQIFEITSKNNDFYKNCVMLLKSAKSRREQGLFIIEGERLLKDANIGGVEIESVVFSEEYFKKNGSNVDKDKVDKIYIFKNYLFEKIADTVNSQGIIALCKMNNGGSVINKSGRYIALENLQDPANVGAIARTAEALGISGLIICGGVDVYSPKVLRASMGTILRLPLFFADNIYSKGVENGMRLIATVPDMNADTINKFEFENGDITIIGNEANGISADTLCKCNCKVTIPMLGKAESLNAAAAAAIVMWEMIK